jgi:hypothetical protein
MAYRETFVQRGQHRIYVRDHAGVEPPIIDSVTRTGMPGKVRYTAYVIPLQRRYL